MAYLIEQKIGKNIYVYEAESRWDKEKKQPRQKRNYLGRKDLTTGEVAKVRGSFKPRYVRDWGNAYLLFKIAEGIRLIPVLKEVYPDSWGQLLSFAIFEVTEGNPLYLFKNWAESTYLVGLPNQALSSQRISEFLKDIGAEGYLRERFYQRWIRVQQDIKSVVFDITSLSSHSHLIESVEWGYNRDDESLPQINFGVVLGQPSCLPLFYTIYPGSIKDVTTLKNILILGDAFGLKDALFILDKGFFSQRNIKEMEREKIRFLIPLPFSTKLSESLIVYHQEQLSSPLNSFLLEKKVIFHSQDEREIGGVKLLVHIYLDEKRKAEETENFLKRIIELERKVKEAGLKRKKEAEEYLEETLKGSSGFFHISPRKGTLQIKRREESLLRIMQRLGKTILISNGFTLEKEETLSLYRRKDLVEKFFDTLKNELKDKRLRIHSQEVLEGRLFVSFLSLILYSALTRTMREKEFFKDYTAPELLSELKKIKMVEMENGRVYFTEVSKKQRDIFQKFGLTIPVAT